MYLSFYHTYNRGVDKREIFSDEEEAFAAWLHALAEANDIDYMNEGMKDRKLEETEETEEVEDEEED